MLLNDDSLDRHSRSWVCVKGSKIKRLVTKIEGKIIKEKKTNREQISKKISKKINCDFGSIKKLLQGKNDFYPMPVILELCKLYGKKEYVHLIESSIEYLKINSASAKPVRASRELSPNFAKIMGAFCADGSLSIQFVISSKTKNKLGTIGKLSNSNIKYSIARKEHYLPITINKENYKDMRKFCEKNKKFQTQAHYAIELTDEHASNVEAFNCWMYKEFQIKPTSFQKRPNKNAYRTIFTNKIVARYIIQFFGLQPGYKTDIVKEPKIIKDSTLEVRKNFARGAIMFDGSVLKNKRIIFTSISPAFTESIKDILTSAKIKVRSFRNKRGEYGVYTTSENKIERLLEYFEKGTKKWDLLMWLSDKEFTSKQVSYENDIKNKEILEIIKDVGSCDYIFLKKRTGLSPISIRRNLLILKSRGIIRLSNKPKIINEGVSEGTTVFLKEKFHNKLFNNIVKKFDNYIKYSNFMGINHSTLSTWKVKKNRIPLRLLKQICISIDASYQKALKNVIETDREIAEII